MTDLAKSNGSKKGSLVDTILGGGNAISNAETAIAPASMTGEKKKKPKSLIGSLGGGSEQLGGV